MDLNPQENSSENTVDQPENLSRYEERRRRREERRAARGNGYGAWIGGAVLIALGIIILLQNLNALTFDNWWALFILVPAVGAFGAAWRNYQEAGRRLTAPVRASIIGGLALTLVAATFLFSLDWGILGPIIIILVGLVLLLNALLP
jgi:hypothetical protein